MTLAQLPVVFRGGADAAWLRRRFCSLFIFPLQGFVFLSPLQLTAKKDGIGLSLQHFSVTTAGVMESDQF